MIRSFIEKNASLVLITGALFGMVLPIAKDLPDYSMIWGLSVVIFFSCSNIRSSDLATINIKLSAGFYIFRFIIAPIALYLAASILAPTIKEAVLILALCPAGTSAPAFSSIFNGNTALALGLLVFSGILVPFTMPGIFELLGQHGLDIDTFSMLRTLCLAIFVPMFLWFVIGRNIKPIRELTRHNSKAGAIVFLSIVNSIAFSKQRDFILDNLDHILIFLLALSIMFLFFFLIGWLWPNDKKSQNQIATTISSTFMNNMLGLTIALIYFDAHTAMFLAMSMFIWIGSIPIFSQFLKKYAQQNA